MASSLNKYLLEHVIQHITSLVQDINIVTKHMKPKFVSDTDYMAKDIWHPLMSPIEKLRLHAFKPSSNDIENESWIKDAFSAIQGLISKGDFYDALKHIINIANKIKAELHLQSSGTAIKHVTEPQEDTKQYIDYEAVIKLYENNSLQSIRNQPPEQNVKDGLNIFSDKDALTKTDETISFTIINNDKHIVLTHNILLLKSIISFLTTFSLGNAIHSHEPNIHICDSIVFLLSQPILYNTQPDIFSDLRDVLISLAERYLDIKKERDEEFARTNAKTSLLENEAAASKVLSKAASEPPPEAAASKQPHKITASNVPPDAAASKQKRKLTIYGVKYSAGPSTDFKELMKTNSTKKLFIYNENFEHYGNTKYLNEGAGNGFLRKYRQDNPKNENSEIKSLGIPTGILGSKDNFIPEEGKISIYKNIVLESTQKIITYIDDHPDINEIYYSISNEKSETCMNIGLNLFIDKIFTRSIAEYITLTIFDMFNKLSTKYDVVIKRVTSKGENTINHLVYQKYDFLL